MTELTTTSHSILALLAVRPWSTYELAQQMRRSVNWFWPAASSVVYEEPKKLVRGGYAHATKEYTGKRARTVYSITPKGRRALKAWLGRPGSGPELYFESLLQVAFADFGTKEQLVENLAAIRKEADSRLEEAAKQTADYAETGGPFPDRLHIIGLVARFALDHAALVAEWSAWAEQSVRSWTDVRSGKAPRGAFEPPQPRNRKRSRAV